MTGVPPPGLEAFHHRIDSGILTAARAARPDDWPARDATAFTSADVLTLLDPVRDVADRTNATTAGMNKALDAAARAFDGHRDRLLTVLLSPGHVLGCIPPLLHTARPPTPPEVWRWMCWITEAAVRHLKTGDDLSLRLLHPLTDRLHFLVLSEPLRHRGDTAWYPPGAVRHPLDAVYGTGSWHVLTDTCAHARRAWLSRLNTYQSHPFLAQAPADRIETELLLLLLTSPDQPAPRTGARPLSTSWKPLTEDAPATTEDLAVRADIIAGHLLPRFRLIQVARLARPGHPPRHDLLRLAVLAAATTAVGLACGGAIAPGAWFWQAAVAAATAYALLGIGAVWHGTGWSAQWLLRFPAAAMLGLFALVSLPPDWWSAPHPRWAWAPAALAAAAFGYLVVEVRNHGAGRGPALLRGAGVFAVGTVHAFLLSLIVLVGIAGTYTQARPDGTGPHTPSLHGLWHHTTGAAWQTLALATAWSLAVGVFSQILWDDRPITASLAHLTWRDGD
ncbi:hypothetical protein ACFZA1_38490 [Streptomyces filipinensis]|uniref:hypothetical protein n=1 Tax=Streptomyces filipinensis TaxID=66887 RepID=UPI0036EF7C92